MIIKCTCNHEFQDKFYGIGMRLANITKKTSPKTGNLTFRCTVCSKEQTIEMSKIPSERKSAAIRAIEGAKD